MTADALIEAVATAIAEAALDEHNVASTTPRGALSFARNMDGDGVMWEHFKTDAESVIAAIEANGFRVVPVEPTQEMCYLAPPYGKGVTVEDVYAAMLSAAPKLTEQTE